MGWLTELNKTLRYAERTA